MNYKQIGAVVALIGVLAGCEPEPSAGGAPASPEGPASPVSPDEAQAVGDAPDHDNLAEALTTRYVSDEDFDAWRCLSDLTDLPVAYVFPAQAAASYTVIDAARGFSAPFVAAFDAGPVDADYLTLEYPSSDTSEFLQNIRFDGADRWASFSSTDGALDCERQVNSLRGG